MSTEPERSGSIISEHFITFNPFLYFHPTATTTTGPPVPPVKPLKLKHQLLAADSLSSSSPAVTPAEGVQYPDSEAAERLQPSPADLRSRSPLEWEQPNSQNLQPPLCSYVERLKREGERGREAHGEEKEEAEARRGLDRSSYHHAIAALENTSEEEEDDGVREEERREKERSSFKRPVIETESTFRPAEFGSRLLPPENKPLEMVVLKRSKELLLSHDHHSIARHLLMADCQVQTPTQRGLMTSIMKPDLLDSVKHIFRFVFKGNIFTKALQQLVSLFFPLRFQVLDT